MIECIPQNLNGKNPYFSLFLVFLFCFFFLSSSYYDRGNYLYLHLVEWDDFMCLFFCNACLIFINGCVCEFYCFTKVIYQYRWSTSNTRRFCIKMFLWFLLNIRSLESGLFRTYLSWSVLACFLRIKVLKNHT